MSDSLPLSDVPSENNAAAKYRAILVDARVKQLKFATGIVKRVDRLLLESAQEVRALYEAIPPGTGTLRRRFLIEKHHELLKVLDNLHADYGKVLGQGLLETAQAAVDREKAIESKLYSGMFGPPLGHPTQMNKVILSDGSQIAVRFGPVALDAVERVMQRVYGDGLMLSDRIWNLKGHTKTGLEDTLVKGLLKGTSAEDLGKELTSYLTHPGADNAYYRAMRLARTEINNAYREANIHAAIDPKTKQLKKHIKAIGWRLSASHPHRDICDVWAADDSANLGEGNYLPGDVPTDHPHGLCFTISVLADFPDITGAQTTAPDVDPVPISELKYWAHKVGDAPAARALAKKLGAILPPPLPGSDLDKRLLQEEIGKQRRQVADATLRARRSPDRAGKLAAINDLVTALDPSPAVQELLKGLHQAHDAKFHQGQLEHLAQQAEARAQAAQTAAERRAHIAEAQKIRALKDVIGALNISGAVDSLFTGIHAAQLAKEQDAALAKLAEDAAKAKHDKYLADARARAKKSYLKKKALADAMKRGLLSSGKYDLDMDALRKLDIHAVEPSWVKSGKRPTYGAAVFDDQGRILLREPTGHHAGYAWTFPKGGMETGDTPVDTALRELLEETGHSGQIVSLVPGTFESGLSDTNLFVMRSTGYDPAQMDHETAAIQWATRAEAEALIQQTTASTGRERDLKILHAAFDQMDLLLKDPEEANKAVLAALKETLAPLVVREFPPTPGDVEIVKRLGGASGAQLVKDKETGKLFVMKKGNNEAHVREECYADAAYQALGVNVPKFRLFETPAGPVKLSEFIEGARTLGDVMKDDPALAETYIEELRKTFLADALLANWDVIGPKYDNTMIGADGRVWHIDNGGALRRSGLGNPKPFNEYATEVWTLRDPQINRETAKVYGTEGIYQIAGQLAGIEERKAALMAALPVDLRPVMTERIKKLGVSLTAAGDMKADRWKENYADRFAKALMDLDRAGIVDRLPQKLKQSPGDTRVKDENGVPFDHLRQLLDDDGLPRPDHRSIVKDLADYMSGTGGDYTIISEWMARQAGSSWSPRAQAMKVFFMNQRELESDSYYWKQGLAHAQEQYDHRLRRLAEKRFGSASELAKAEEMLTRSWVTQHAFTYQLLTNVDFRYNDRAARVQRVIRTEFSFVLRDNDIDPLKRAQDLTMKRGSHESGSLFKAVFPVGSDTTTVQAVPHIRCTGIYFQEQKPGGGMPAYAGDYENEITWLTEGIPFECLGGNMQPELDGGL